ncbi:hypothetical protein A361_15615 [Cytobacillus oceanisediminis 2691]|uniref:Uncharacterized protein n=1 Tax=Cytobacillus oceanisediminis 2691 TaxID=1196031 RepID=A0A160MC83_9BACI|nr:hypothetical protein A361_15615 [Cytobacillus oceanisediminis 2691]
MIHDCFQKKSLLIFQVTHRFKIISFNSILGGNIQDYNPSFAVENGLHRPILPIFKIVYNIPLREYS